MKIFKIKETHEIIRGYKISYYEVCANTKEEAVEIINNINVKPVQTDYDSLETEYLETEIL